MRARGTDVSYGSFTFSLSAHTRTHTHTHMIRTNAGREGGGPLATINHVTETERHDHRGGSSSKHVTSGFSGFYLSPGRAEYKVGPS